MSKVKFNQVIEDVKGLQVHEQRGLRDLLNTWLNNGQAKITEDEFEQKLVQLGVLSSVKPLVANALPRRRLVPIKGKPLSETIIEERG